MEELTAKGINGSLIVNDKFIEIVRKGFMAFATQGLKGNKRIAIKQISAVQFKHCGIFTNGFIQFSFIGGQETKSALVGATHDENTIMFRKKQQPNFEKIRNFIEEKIY